jgi:hypothetical protein
MLKLVANMARQLLATKERCEVIREAKIICIGTREVEGC